MNESSIQLTAPQASTLAEIHRSEDRALRRGFFRRAGVLALFGFAWWITGHQARNPFLLFIGVFAVSAVAAYRAWAQHRARDPHVDYRLIEAAQQSVTFQEVHAYNLRLHERGTWVTYSVIALLLAVGAIEAFVSSGIGRVVEVAGLVKPAVRAGEWWRLVTATYLHANLLHIVANLGALATMGKTLEGYLPRWRLPFVYLVAGLSGSLASVMFSTASSIGASGAILGIAGFLLAYNHLRPGEIPKPVSQAVLSTAVMTAVIGAFAFAIIDNAAHAGGFVGGAFVAWLTTSTSRDYMAARTAIPARDAAWAQVAGVMSAVAIVAGALVTGAMLWRFSPALSADASVPVTSISIGVASDASGSLVLRAVNQSSRRLDAWEIQYGAGAMQWTTWQDYCCYSMDTTRGPLGPGEVWERRLASPINGVSRSRAAARPLVVVFDDGSFEGSADRARLILAHRQSAAADAAFWIRAIDAARSMAPEATLSFLNARMDEREAEVRQGRETMLLFGMAFVMSTAASRPAELGGVLAAERDRIADAERRFAQAIASLERHLGALSK